MHESASTPPEVTAVILAGGRGTRLVGAEPDPKPLVRVGGRTLLEHQLALLAKAGVARIYVAVAHDDERVAAAASSSAEVVVRRDSTPYPGTAAAVAEVASEIIGSLAVLFADTVTSMRLSRLLDAHFSGSAALTMPVQPTDYELESHMVEVDGDYVVRFLGRPTAIRQLPNLTFHPYFVVAGDHLSVCRGGEGDFVNDVLPRFLSRAGGIQAVREGELILDCGTPERLARARRLVEAGWLE